MITKPIHVLEQYPVRKSKNQKMEFRDAAVLYFENLGYDVNVEAGSFGAKNIVVGNPDTATHLITAHYDTPAGMLIPNLITPCHFLPFLLWQIVMVVMILGPAALIAVLIGNLAKDYMLALDVLWLLCLVESLFMMFGPANPNNANDNTSGVIAVMDIAYNLPKNLRNRVCFVLFDLEEAGLVGSASYAKKHAKAVKTQIVLNMDCVGDGDTLMFFPSRKFRASKSCMTWLNKWDSMWMNGRYVAVRASGFMFYPSDQLNFPYGIGISALRKNRFGWLYCDKVHTKKDVNFDYKNVSVLSDCIINMVRNSRL